MYVLEVMSGPLDGTQWRFDREITIGRDEGSVGACITIDRYLSRSHARLLAENQELFLIDLSSRNGTTVDGVPVERVPLHVGKVFSCGKTFMRVLEEDAESCGDLAFAAPLSCVSDVHEMRSRLLAKPIGFIPTMGALHEGHLSLVRRAQAECASVVVSIFVNPLQFAPGEDFELYPRDLSRDLQLLAESGISVVFTPDVAGFYPPGFATGIDVGPIATLYEGAVRPTHFRGVATVVTKLLHVIAPTRVYLGQKDAQQIAVLRQVLRDLDFSTEIVVVPTSREADGLARSSRNVYLTQTEREVAPVLYQALCEAAAAYKQGHTAEQAVLVGKKLVEETLAATKLEAELAYLELVDADCFTPVAHSIVSSQKSLAIGALRMAVVRLLDNVPVSDA